MVWEGARQEESVSLGIERRNFLRYYHRQESMNMKSGYVRHLYGLFPEYLESPFVAGWVREGYGSLPVHLLCQEEESRGADVGLIAA
jgi:hypothetical protein